MKVLGAQTINFWRPQGFDGLELFYIPEVPAKNNGLEAQLIEQFHISSFRQGHTHIRYRRKTWDFEAGDLAVAQPNESISSHFLKPTRDFKSMLIQPELFINLVESKRRPILPTFMLQDKALNHLMTSSFLACFNCFQHPASSLERSTNLTAFLTKIVHYFSGDIHDPKDLAPEHRAVQIIKDYLHAHYKEAISLEDLSKLTNLSKYYVIRIFNKQVGISPHAYQTSLRLHEAKRLLRLRDQGIAHVASETGFADQAHFTRKFKRFLGLTPKQYRHGIYPKILLR